MVRDEVADPLRVSHADMRRAAVWMHEHRFTSIEPTPLLAARLRMRRWVEWGLFGVAIVLVVPMTLVLVAFTGPPDEPDQTRLVIWILVVGLVPPLKWLRHRLLLRSDRRLGASLVRRVAHSTVPGWSGALGIPGLAAIAVTYGGSLTLAVIAATMVDTAQDRLVLAFLLPGYVFIAAMTAFEIRYAIGRPALADDPVSLAVDDVLRAEAVRAAASDTLPLITTAATMIALEPDVVGRISGFIYALIVLVLAAQLVLWYSGRRRTATVERPPVAS